MAQWRFEDLIIELEQAKSRGELHQFYAEFRDTHRREYYLTGGDAKAGRGAQRDQVRSVMEREFMAHIHVEKEGHRLGSAHKMLDPYRKLQPQIRSLRDLAMVTDEEWWEAPDPQVKNVATRGEGSLISGQKEDPTKYSDHLVSGYIEQITKSRSGEFNSAEIFSSLHHVKSIAGNGFVFEHEFSRFYAEVCFSARGANGREDNELLLTDWYGHPDQLNMTELCVASCDGASALAQAKLTPGGTYSVIVSAEVLRQIFDDVLWQLDGHQQYMKMPHKKENDTLIPKFKGTPFKVVLNPEIPFTLTKRPYSSLGFFQTPLTLIEDNKVMSCIRPARIAQYLKSTETTSLGAVCIEPTGSTSTLAGLIQSSPGPVLEIVQFSGLFCSPLDLTFSSEIRLAKLHNPKDGSFTWVKGGNLSGNFTENFANVKWSSERGTSQSHLQHHNSCYVGPRYALLDHVSVSS